MAFVQKDKNSRKDKLDIRQEGDGTAKDENGMPRVVIHKEADGSKHLHMLWPNEGRNSSPHLDDLLRRLEAKHEVEEASAEEIEAAAS